jgi:hypothetical protein
MKISELIEILQSFPDDLIVHASAEGGQVLTDVDGAFGANDNYANKTPFTRIILTEEY